MLRALIALFALAAGWAAPAAAEPREALIIANADYEGAFPALANPHADGAAVKAALERAGFRVTLALDADERAMGEAMRDLRVRLTEAGPDAVGLFYFAGHGAQWQGINYMVPTGAQLRDKADLPREALRLRQVFDELRISGNAANFVIIDACRDAPLPDPLDPTRSADQGLARETAPAASGLKLFFSAQPGQKALDGPPGETSPFAAAFAATLREPGLSEEQVFRLVATRVFASTKKRQLPWPEGVLTGETAFVFTPGEAAPRPVAPAGPAPASGDQILFAALETPCEYAAFARDHAASPLASLAKSRARGALPCDAAGAGGAASEGGKAIIREAQRLLGELGCGSGAADGVAGEATRRAVARFRLATNTAGEGVDAALLAALKAAQAEGVTCPSDPAAKPVDAARARSPSDAFAAADSGRAVSERAFQECDVCPVMVAVPGGAFMMGQSDSEPLIYAETPRHRVAVKSFAIGRFELTWDEWEACVAEGGCDDTQVEKRDFQKWGRGRLPAVFITWTEGKAYMRWLSQKTGARYRLPTEAEWEYAARAGAETAYWWGAKASHDYANYGLEPPQLQGAKEGADQWRYTAPVGSFPANAFGLHDVAGNVAEFVEDCWFQTYKDAPTDGSARTAPDCQNRILKGGSWVSGSRGVRAASKDTSTPDFTRETYGFRVVRER